MYFRCKKSKFMGGGLTAPHTNKWIVTASGSTGTWLIKHLPYCCTKRRSAAFIAHLISMISSFHGLPYSNYTSSHSRVYVISWVTWLTCINNALIRCLQQQPQLWVHDISLSWGHSKKCCIKFAQVLQLSIASWQTMHTWHKQKIPCNFVSCKSTMV